MRVCTLKDHHEKELIKEIKRGALFIYPTDTIYGIGCNALKPASVRKIRRLKRTKHPFSVIAPSKIWIQKNLHARPKHLDRLPGRYTLILRKRRSRFLHECSKTNKLGVRIPRHPFTSLVKRAGVPFVTTSVNVSGKPSTTRVSRIPQSFLKEIDFVVDAGTLDRRASTIWDLTGEKPKKVR